MGVRILNVTPVSHLVKAEPLYKNFFSKKVSEKILKCVSPKKNFKHDEQKGLNQIKKVNV